MAMADSTDTRIQEAKVKRWPAMRSGKWEVNAGNELGEVFGVFKRFDGLASLWRQQGQVATRLAEERPRCLVKHIEKA